MNLQHFNLLQKCSWVSLLQQWWIKRMWGIQTNFPSYFSSQSQKYRKYIKFNRMKGAVNCLSFNPSMELLVGNILDYTFLLIKLVAGDDETVWIWELSTKSCVQVLEDHGKRWGQITCLALLGRHNNTSLSPIIFGTACGLLVIYCHPRIGVSSNLLWRSSWCILQNPMVELASSHAFKASHPVKAMAYDADKCHLAVTSHHGQIMLYDIGRNSQSS